MLVIFFCLLASGLGVLRGITEGVESFFYEPYAGLVQGPSEFIEGVALGVMSLVGNTLGEHIVLDLSLHKYITHRQV